MRRGGSVDCRSFDFFLFHLFFEHGAVGFIYSTLSDIWMMFLFQRGFVFMCIALDSFHCTYAVMV